MRKIFPALVIVVLALCACQREPDFSMIGTTEPAPPSDTIKAVVFDGPLYLSSQTFDYDSLVYKILASGSSIRHYAKNGLLMWEELFRYDNQRRLTDYYVDGMNFRHCQFSYSGVDSFPSLAVDSFSDGTLMVHALTRRGSSPDAGGRILRYSLRYDVPGTGYNERYDVYFAFDSSGHWFSAVNEGFSSEREDHHFYTKEGLPDSTISSHTTLSTADSSGNKIEYTAYANPLARLGRLVYRNLNNYQPLSLGYYSRLFSVGSAPDGMYAEKMPLLTKEYANGGSVYIRRSFTYQFQNNTLKAARIETTEDGYGPATAVASVRIYQ